MKFDDAKAGLKMWQAYFKWVKEKWLKEKEEAHS